MPTSHECAHTRCSERGRQAGQRQAQHNIILYAQANLVVLGAGAVPPGRVGSCGQETRHPQRQGLDPPPLLRLWLSRPLPPAREFVLGAGSALLVAGSSPPRGGRRQNEGRQVALQGGNPRIELVLYMCEPTLRRTPGSYFDPRPSRSQGYGYPSIALFRGGSKPPRGPALES